MIAALFKYSTKNNIMKNLSYLFAAVLFLSLSATTTASAQIKEDPHSVKQMQKEAKVDINTKKQTKAKAIGVGERPNSGPADKGGDDKLKINNEAKEKAIEVGERPNSGPAKKAKKKDLNKKTKKKAQSQRIGTTSKFRPCGQRRQRKVVLRRFEQLRLIKE